MQQGTESCADVFDRAEQRDGRLHRNRQEQPRERAAADGKDELVLILAVERTGRMLRQAGKRRSDVNEKDESARTISARGQV